MLDEPTSALDPIATANIEEMLTELKKQYTIIIAPHNVQQAARPYGCCTCVIHQ